MMRVLVTCPPMLARKEQFLPVMQGYGVEVHCPEVVQTLSEAELKDLVPQFDGWIIGDDPATRAVLEAGTNGKLKAAVKWGVGVDNVDFVACKELGVAISHTPGMFGQEVADIAMSYLTALARQTFFIDRSIREGAWPKPQGMSLAGKTVGLIGYGDIGRNLFKRLSAADMRVIIYDPMLNMNDQVGASLQVWPAGIELCDFLAFTCSLNKANTHMLNASVLSQCKTGVRIVNVARGKLINESALTAALSEGKVHSVALDVFEVEPVPASSVLRQHPYCILGSHNSSNTLEAVERTNLLAIQKLMGFLGIEST